MICAEVHLKNCGKLFWKFLPRSLTFSKVGYCMPQFYENKDTAKDTFIVVFQTWVECIFVVLLIRRVSFCFTEPIWPKTKMGSCFGSFKKYVPWGEEGRGSLKSEQKRTGWRGGWGRGERVLACVFIRFFLKKKAEVFKNEVLWLFSSFSYWL